MAPSCRLLPSPKGFSNPAEGRAKRRPGAKGRALSALQGRDTMGFCTSAECAEQLSSGRASCEGKFRNQRGAVLSIKKADFTSDHLTTMTGGTAALNGRLFFPASLGAYPPLSSDRRSANCVRADGRTLTLTDGRDVRLAGIEVPNETGTVARAALEKLLAGHDVRLLNMGPDTDRYGRFVGGIAGADGPRRAAPARPAASSGRRPRWSPSSGRRRPARRRRPLCRAAARPAPIGAEARRRPPGRRGPTRSPPARR